MSDDILFDCETCDAAGRIAALEAENDKLLEERHELKNELAKWLHYWRDKGLKAVEAENEKLRAALAPFVDAGHFKVVTRAGTAEEHNTVSIYVEESDLRAARAAMGETE